MFFEILLVMSNITIFHINLIFNIIVLKVDLSNNFIITKPEISSKKWCFFFITISSFGFNTVSPLGNVGIDLFKKLKQHSHVFMTPSNSNTFLIPKTISTFHVFWISIIVWMMKSMLTYCPSPT